MAQSYVPVSTYISSCRISLQDKVAPYRYSDDQIIDALNLAISEAQRLRPDIFLDLKYQRRLTKGDIGDGIPGPYTSADTTPLVPVPSKYRQAFAWYMTGWVQFTDVSDTTDARAQAFMSKFQSQLLTLSAA